MRNFGWMSKKGSPRHHTSPSRNTWPRHRKISNGWVAMHAALICGFLLFAMNHFLFWKEHQLWKEHHGANSRKLRRHDASFTPEEFAAATREKKNKTKPVPQEHLATAQEMNKTIQIETAEKIDVERMSNDLRYHHLDPINLTSDTPQMNTIYNKADIVTTRKPWFAPRKVCKTTCCSQRVAVSLDQDDHNIINTLDGPDLADILIYRYFPLASYRTVLAADLLEDLLPCLQPGTIIHVDNHACIYEHFFDRYLQNISVPFVFMTTNSDADSPIKFLPKYRAQLDNKRLIRWYGTNPRLESNDSPGRRQKFMPMPLGLSAQHHQTPYLERYLRARNYTNPFSGDLKRRWTESTDLAGATNTSTVMFVKFGINNRNKSHRQAIYDAVCKSQHPQHEDAVSCSLKAFKPDEIYRAASKHLFGLSPPGLGYDCYRTYELLLLGVIPIIAKRDDDAGLFQDLPVIRIDNFNETQSEYLHIMREYVASDEFQENDFAGWERLFLRYWRRMILHDTGRDKDIIQDETGREFYQAWSYTLYQAPAPLD